MDFFQQKVNNYRIYTQQTYQQLANQLDVHYSTLYNIIQNPYYPTIKRKVLNNFTNLIESIQNIENITTPWIDLFLPKIPGATHAMFLFHEDCWATAEDPKDIPAIMSNGRFEYSDNRKLCLLKHFRLPRFPISILPNSISLYTQTEQGWEQVHRVSAAVMKFEEYYINAANTHKNINIKGESKIRYY